MIKFNETYFISNEESTIVFSEGKKGTVNASYDIKGKKDTGTINGTLDGNILKGTFHNKIGNSIGLIEFEFTENEFNAKWKNGLEPGPMRGKWNGKLQGSVSKVSIFNIAIERDTIIQKMELLLTESVASKKQFCEEMISFSRENQELLWVLPLYSTELRSLKFLIDENEIEGNADGFLDEDELLDEFSTRIFSKYALFYDSNINEFAYQEDDDTDCFMHFILEDLNFSMDDFIMKLKENSADSTALYNKFLAQIRTTLYSTIVRAYLELNNQNLYSLNDIANIIISPLDDEKFKSTVSNETNIIIGDDLFLAIEDVLYCLKIDLKDEDFDEDWGDYSINFEKIADYIYGQESYNFPLIEI